GLAGRQPAWNRRPGSAAGRWRECGRGSWACLRGGEKRELQSSEVASHALPVAGGGRAASGTVVMPGSPQPVAAAPVLLAQQLGGNAQVADGLQRGAGAGEALAVVAPVDLRETNVDACGWRGGQRLLQGLTGGALAGEAPGLTGDVQRPGPGAQLAAQGQGAFLQGDGVKDFGRNAGLPGDLLVGCRRQLPRLGAAEQGQQEQAHSRRCHRPSRCWKLAGSGTSWPRRGQRPRSWLRVICRRCTRAGSMPAWRAQSRSSWSSFWLSTRYRSKAVPLACN